MAAIEKAVKKTDWPALTGVILDGGYELKEPFALDETSATFKVRILGSCGQEATVSFFQADLAQAEEQLSFWQTLREWPHPNINLPLAAGYRWLGEVGAVYAVLPIPDERLSGVLKERHLDAAEAGEVVRSVTGALGHLHACGLAHGAISPDTVLALGDSVQLSTGSVRRQGADLLISPPEAHYMAPESAGFNNTAAADIWCLGATLFEILSQQRYTPADNEKIRTLPYSLLLQKTLEATPDFRCTLPEALAIFAQGPKAAAPAPLPPPVPEPTPESIAPVKAVTIEPEASAEAPASAPDAVPADAADAVTPQTSPTAPENEPIEPAKEKAAAASAAPGLTAGVAAGEQARQEAATHNAFQRSRSSYVKNSILAEPLPLESRQTLADIKRKPILARIKQMSGGGVETGDFRTNPAARSRLSSQGLESKAWAQPKVRAWQIAVAVGAVVVMLLAVLFLVLLPRMRTPTEVTAPLQSNAASTAANGTAWQTKTLTPADSRSEPAKHLPAAQPEAADRQTPPASGTWRLVLYSYQYRKDAERRLVLLGRSFQNPDFHLFTPAKRGPFMVVMGNQMSKAAVEELKQKAIAQGLPRAMQVRRF